MRLIAILSLFGFVWNVHAWGAVGHEIVATIAEIYLDTSAREVICHILSNTGLVDDNGDSEEIVLSASDHFDSPKKSSCHLAKVASWADQVKGRMRWSSALHYVNGNGDHPPSTCVFGQEGWQGAPRINVLSAIQNTTQWLLDGRPGADEALKFLVHFMGDLHMPLHLTGRNKGGNGDRVKWQGRSTNFHSVWDSRIISELIYLTPRKYDRRLPNAPSIESRLRGTIYDPFIRQILVENVFDDWAKDIESWILCPDSTFLTQASEHFLEKVHTTPIPETDTSLACPYYWAKPIHDLHCQFIWPPAIADEHHKAVEIYTPGYMNILRKDKTVERLLAMAGIRLAAVLNGIFASEPDSSSAKAFIP